MAATRELAAFEEAGHGLAFMEFGIPLAYLRADRNGGGRCEPVESNSPLLSPRQHLFVSLAGPAAQALGGEMHALPSEHDLAQVPWLDFSSETDRRGFHRNINSWVWQNESPITALASATLQARNGVLAISGLIEVVDATPSLRKFSRLYDPWRKAKPVAPAVTSKPAKPDLADRVFAQFLTRVSPRRAVAACGIFG